MAPAGPGRLSDEKCVKADLERQASTRTSRVVTLGTSLTCERHWRFWKGCGGQWVTLMRDTCTRRDEGRVDVENRARWGCDSAWALRNHRRLLSGMCPDVCVLEFSVNDADLRRGISVDRSGLNLSSLLGILRDTWTSCRTLVLITNPVFGRHAISRPALSAYYARARDVARETGVDIVDTEPVWNRALMRQPWSHWIPDGIHPNLDAARNITYPQVHLGLVRLSPW